MKSLLKRLVVITLIFTTGLGVIGCNNKGENATEMVAYPPPKLDVSKKYTYEYMGLSFTLPDDLNDMIRNNRTWMHYESNINEDNSINFAFMYFQLIPEDKKDTNLATYDDYLAWLEKGQRIGTIGIFSKDYLKNNPVEKLTGCKTNEELGQSSDGKFIFYLSTNSIEEANAESLLKQSDITISDPALPPTDVPYFSIIGATRPKVSDLGDFEAQNLNGDKFKNDIFKEYDLTMVNLWTTTCGYCIEEMPVLEEIRNEMQKKGINFNIIGMCLDINKSGKIDDNKLDKAKKIIEKTGVTYETLIPDEVLWQGRMKGVDAFPETFFVDKNGKIVGKTVLGANGKDGWIEIINKELKSVSK